MKLLRFLEAETAAEGSVPNLSGPAIGDAIRLGPAELDAAFSDLGSDNLARPLTDQQLRDIADNGRPPPRSFLLSRRDGSTTYCQLLQTIPLWRQSLLAKRQLLAKSIHREAREDRIKDANDREIIADVPARKGHVTRFDMSDADNPPTANSLRLMKMALESLFGQNLERAPVRPSPSLSLDGKRIIELLRPFQRRTAGDIAASLKHSVNGPDVSALHDLADLLALCDAATLSAAMDAAALAESEAISAARLARAKRQIADRYEVRRLRAEALAKIDAKIIAVNAVLPPPSPRLSREAIPKDVKHDVWRRDHGRCVQCGSQERLHFDHVIPVSKGGGNTARNIQLLCEKCNLSKGDRI